MAGRHRCLPLHVADISRPWRGRNFRNPRSTDLGIEIQCGGADFGDVAPSYVFISCDISEVVVLSQHANTPGRCCRHGGLPLHVVVARLLLGDGGQTRGSAPTCWWVSDAISFLMILPLQGAISFVCALPRAQPWAVWCWPCRPVLCPLGPLGRLRNNVEQELLYHIFFSCFSAFWAFSE